MTRILILTAGYGEGHNAAARNLAEALNSETGPGTAHIADLFALASPRLNQITRRGYLSLINRAPRLWSSLYAHLDRHPPFPRHLWLLRQETRALEKLLTAHRPQLIASTYPVYAYILENLVRLGRPVPHFVNIVTDSISIHSLWTRPRCAAWYAPNSETATVLRTRHRLPPERVHDFGFPVPAAFSQRTPDLQPPPLSLFNYSRPRVLYLLHSGTLHAEETARRLLRETDYALTLAIGRDHRLRERLTRIAADRPHPTQILGWTDQIPRLLMTHHVIISKAGGATTQEAIAAHCPMIVNQIVPGQEEGNYELLRRHDIGAHAPTPNDILHHLAAAFADHAQLYQRWRDALRNISRPHAARDIARHLLQNAEAHEDSSHLEPQLRPQPHG